MKRIPRTGMLLLAAVASIWGTGCDSDSSGGGMLNGSDDGPDAVTLVAGPDTTLRGNATGGSLARDVCPENQMLVGLAGSQGSGGWLVELQAICGAPQTHGAGGGEYEVIFDPGATLDAHGKLAGTDFTRDCPDDRVLIGFRGRSGLLIDQLVLQCARVVYGQDENDLWTHELRDPLELDPAGGNGGTAFGWTNCPAGQVARGANIRHGDSIDAFGMICATPTAVDLD